MSNGVVRAIEVVFASDRSMNRKIAPDRSPHLAHPVGSRHADSLTAHQVNSSPSLWSFKCRSFPAVSGGRTPSPALRRVDQSVFRHLEPPRSVRHHRHLVFDHEVVRRLTKIRHAPAPRGISADPGELPAVYPLPFAGAEIRGYLLVQAHAASSRFRQ